MKVSVITPSIRPEGLEIVANSLSKQSFKDIEWLICGPEINREKVLEVVGGIFPPIYIGNPPLKEGMFWDLNYSYNRLIKKATGDIIVTWQDWIYANRDALEKFVKNVEDTGGVVSGVGDQYLKLNKYGKPELKVWGDCRKTDRYGSFYACNWNDAEFNFAAFPRELAYRVGGFDEKLDFLGVGGDQLQFCERLNDIGVTFYLDQSLESFTLRHDRSDFGGQEEWDSKHVLFKKGKSGMSFYDERKLELKQSGQWPILTYLTNR